MIWNRYTDLELKLFGDLLTWKCIRCGIKNNKANIIEKRDNEEKTGLCLPCVYNNKQTTLEEWF